MKRSIAWQTTIGGLRLVIQRKVLFCKGAMVNKQSLEGTVHGLHSGRTKLQNCG